MISAHLDEMNRTDGEPPENRDHHNLMAFVEAEAFQEKYPERELGVLELQRGAVHVPIRGLGLAGVALKR